ncbi:MAG TPA: GNAT family N-acetyltransferase [Chitinophaga sp.]|uniref:GNAT family N-acetyltransferase n=1 Tax=Chitinophaga sp. TaxID=1869181 RepID=UPI002BBC6C93|nr:GNAT family N-acetyltransferase [Chitinophaga sp.]HVI48495.1 GNAT family N-acetyltransferase [Chitinophaga sp.]
MLPLQTSRLLLRACRLPLITEIYLEDVHAATTLQASIPPEWPQQDLKALLPHYIEILQDDPQAFPWLLWVIIDVKADALLGHVGFKGRPDREGAVELCYSMLPLHRNRGYMQEAAAALISWAFRQPHVRKIIAECDVTNIPSRKVLQKLGMQETGHSGELLFWQLMNR